MLKKKKNTHFEFMNNILLENFVFEFEAKIRRTLFILETALLFKEYFKCG